jgi:hypothetical protein
MPPVVTENWLFMVIVPVAGWLIYQLRTFLKEVSGRVKWRRFTLTIKER